MVVKLLTKKQLRHCPDCNIELKFSCEFNTEWYGNLKYYLCKSCEETFVSQNNGELGIAAI